MSPRSVTLLAALGLLSLLGACVPVKVEPGLPERGEVGAACEAPADCDQIALSGDDKDEDGGRICLKTPAGYCTTGCYWSLGCPEGSICEDLGDPLTRFCLDGCLSSSDCRDDYRCDMSNAVVSLSGESAGVCRVRCSSDAACRAGQVCDQGSGQCLPAEGAVNGQPCGGPDDCRSGQCMRGFPEGGYCTQACGTGVGDRCHDGSSCVAVAATSSLCLVTCEAGEGGCRQGYACLEQDGRNVCMPRCDAGRSCTGGAVCDAATGACVIPGEDAPPPAEPAGCSLDNQCRDDHVCVGAKCVAGCVLDGCGQDEVCDEPTNRCKPAPPADPPPAQGVELREQDLGSVTVGPGGSDNVVLRVAEGDLAAALIATGTRGQFMTVLELTDPDGTTLFRFDDPFAGAGVRVLPTADVLTLLLPPSPRLPLKAGPYNVRLIRNGGDRAIAVRGVFKEGEIGDAALQLVVHLVGVPGVNAAGASDHAGLQSALATMMEVLGEGGLTLGDLSYRDAPADKAAKLRVIETVDGPTSELAELFRLSDDDGALHMFLVEEIIGGDAGFTILGVAGGIPGPPLAGTGASGVAVTALDLDRNPGRVGRTMAHEGGHFLGLYHTTEREGGTHDPLPDTPECSARNDSNGDGFVVPGECRSKGADNMMFWAADAAAEKVSRDQGWVAKRNPLVR